MNEIEKIEKIAEKIISNLDNIVKIALNLKKELNAPDRVLLDAYVIIKESLKRVKGSGSGFTGLSEYLYFQYIKKALENEFNAEFEKIKTTRSENDSVNKKKPMKSHKYLFYFILKHTNFDIYLSSDIPLKHFKEKLSYLGEYTKKQPDIFVAVERNNEFIPIAFIEIKVHIDAGKIRTDIITKFTELRDIFLKEKKEVPYLIFIDMFCNDTKERNEPIQEFLEISKTKSLLSRFIPGKELIRDGLADGVFDEKGSSISEITQKIIEKIKTLSN